MDFYMILSCLIDSNIMVVLYIAVRFFKALYPAWFMRKSWWQQFWPTPQLSEPSMKKEARSFLSPARIGQTIVPTLILWRYRPHFHPLKPSCLWSSVEWSPHWCPHSHQSRRRIGKCGKSVKIVYKFNLVVIVSSSTIDKIYDIYTFYEIDTKFTLFTKIGTKFAFFTKIS